MNVKNLMLAVLVTLPITAAAQIKITSATYGSNCGAVRDNAKQLIEAACNGQVTCTYRVEHQVLGDPAPGCAKTFVAEWTCAEGSAQHRRELPSEAGFGSELKIACGAGGFVAGTVATPSDSEAKAAAAAQVSPPSLQVMAINPPQPISNSSWTVHFRLTNNWLAKRPLTGWIEAIAYDTSDPTKAQAITGQSYPIAELQFDNVAEGDLAFTNTGEVANGRLELTFFNISTGYTPQPRSADGVLPDVPPQVKVQLLQNGNARALSSASSHFIVVPSEAERIAPVFDFDTDSCYPSAAISDKGVLNPGLDEDVSGLTSGCRQPDQLQTARTYYRKASLRRDGTDYAVHMYALYFMKDKTVDTPVDSGHRHDWEFALVWTTNGVITHATASAHWWAETRPIAEVSVDPGAPSHVKIVYHKDGGSTHAMRFAGAGERAENHLGRWVTPKIVDWHTMTIGKLSNGDLRALLNKDSFGSADCSVNDSNFAARISKGPPPGYPSSLSWKNAAMEQ